MALGSLLGGAIAAFGVGKVGGWLYDKVFGGGRRGRRGRGRSGGRGGGPNVTQVSRYDPAMERMLNQRLPQILEELMAEPEAFPELQETMQKQHEVFGPQAETPGMPPEADLSTLDFGPIAAQAQQRFQRETIPTLAERFTSITGGGQRSGAFERQKAKAAEGLDTGLAALQAQLQPQYDLQRAQYGLQRGQLAGQLGQLGLQSRGQKLREGQFALQHSLAERAPAAQRTAMLAGLLTGGVASPYHQVVQPQAPSFMQSMAPGLGQAGMQLGTQWLGQKLGLFS